MSYAGPGGLEMVSLIYRPLLRSDQPSLSTGIAELEITIAPGRVVIPKRISVWMWALKITATHMNVVISSTNQNQKQEKLDLLDRWASNAHALTQIHGCACTLDGVKNVEGWTNGQGDSRSRIHEIFSIKYQISVLYKGKISWIFSCLSITLKLIST